MYLLLYSWCLLFIAHLHHTDTVHASLETVCNNTLTDSTGVIRVPENSSLTGVYCELTISVSPGDFIIFSLHSMDTDRSCSSFLDVYDGNDTSSLIGSTCYSGCSSPYYSNSNSMILTFTVGSNGIRRLMASYVSFRCPPNKYLIDCSRSCPCVQENTEKCSIRYGTCECKDGWTSWDCSQDVNECLSPTACPEYSTCVNLNGSYECQCYEGLHMSSSGHCEVAVECTGTNCSHVCARVTENAVEVDKCVCPVGMELNGTECIECTHFKYGRNCEHSCQCSTPGTAMCDPRFGNCTCHPGWTSDLCQEDVNECSNGSSICGYEAGNDGGYCRNTLGSYNCVCFDGYEKTAQGTCQLINCNLVFTNTTGVFTSPMYPSRYYSINSCSWEIQVENGSIIELSFRSLYPTCEGYSYVNVYDGETPTSPALLSNRRCGQNTLNETLYSTNNTLLITLNGSSFFTDYSSQTFIATYRSISCPPFIYLPDCSASCNCDQANSARCDLLTGRCVCLSGWTSNDCSVNVNECRQSPCLNYTTCTDTIGSYQCRCQDGLQMNPVSGQCEVPLNSTCTLRNCSHLCVRVHENGQDIDQCRCPVGSKLEGDTCQVCSNLTYGEDCQWECDCVEGHTASCDPTSGQCSCLSGWRSSNCSLDIDECSTGLVYCGLHSECINTPGSYVCQCSEYYEKNANGTCVYTGCVKTLTQTSGVVKSPNYPSAYNSNSNCQWSIIVPANYTISLNFTSLQTECNYDYVTVYDGLYTSSPQLGRNCTLSPGTSLQSSANSMLITFTSDFSVQLTGFKATYNASGCPPFKYLPDCSGDCDCVQQNAIGCNKKSGQCLCKNGFMLPNCSEDINECLNASICPEFSRCVNIIGSYMCECYEGLQMSQSGVCIVNASSQCSDTNCSHICAKVVENNTISERCYCRNGSRLKDNTCEVCSNFTYGANCESHCDCNSDTAWFCHPMLGQCYCRPGWNSSNCSVDINECSFYTFICGSNSQCINTPGSYRCQCLDGYELDAQGRCSYNCVKNFTQLSGVITSPNYPSVYEPGHNCRWLITVPENNFITLNFSDLMLECRYDYVTVYDGNNTSAPQLDRLCEKPFGSLMTTSNTMYITFTSDSSVQYTGFMATFNATGCPPFKYLPPQCNGTCTCVQENSQYCNIFTGQCVCKTGWTGPDCSVDVDECLDLPCTNYSQCVNSNGSYECSCLNGLTKSADSGLCEVDVNSTCTKRNCSDVCVKVTENKKKVEKCYCPVGSKLIGTTCKACDKFTYGSECQNKCSCTSKNAASCDPVHGRCTCLTGWRSHSCSVDIDECSTGNVTCGKNSQCVNTRGSYKCVCNDNFGMDALGYCVFKGFIKQLTNSSGVILSPGYPYFYSRLLNSRWTITVSKGHVIQLNLTEVDTECFYDDVKVYDGDNELSKPLGRFCRSPNATLVSSNNKLLIVFTSDMDISGTGFMATYSSTQL